MAFVIFPLLACGCSMLFTFALLFVRSRVRTNRQRVIDELGLIFFTSKDKAVAAFDYARAKYEMQTLAEQKTGKNLPKPVGTWALIGAAVPYMVLCALGFMILFTPLQDLISAVPGVRNYLVLRNIYWTMGHSQAAILTSSAASFGAAFLGSYLMTARTLLRAVQNYELTQLTFLQNAAHMGFGLVSGVFASQVFVIGGQNIGADWSASLTSGATVLVLAFAAGYAPDLGITSLFRLLKVHVIKTADEEVLKNAKVTPLEALDGIDTEVRNRLNQSSLYDVQNLAVANPLLLFVETPYSLYQCFDWILQAQLCVATGIKTYERLRALNIRTSLDLERAVLGDDAPDRFVEAVGRIIFSAPETDDASPAPAFGKAEIQHGAMVMLDDLHVHRMRALWVRIFTTISADGKDWVYRGRKVEPCAPQGGAAQPTEAAPEGKDHTVRE